MKINYFLALSIGFVVILLSSIINIFLKIRFGIIYTSRIGHLCYNVEVYLNSRNNDEFTFFGTQKRIANKLILENWRLNKRVYFNKFGFYGYFFLKRIFPKNKMLIQWEELYPNYSKLISKNKIFNTNFLKKNKDQILKKKKIKTPFICFHNRDSNYLKHIGGDGNDHDFRDYKFLDYSSSIKYLSSKAIYSIRMGRKAEKFKLIKKFSSFYDFSNKKSNDFIDIFLINNCEFLVSSATGLSNMATLLRKKMVLVNAIPFWLREMYQYTPGSIFLPKKIFSIKKNRLLKFFEIENLDYNIHEKNFFKKRNLKVVNNSKEEIYLAVKEMFENYKKKNSKKYLSNLHNKFWNTIDDKRAVNIIRNKLQLNIADSFLKKNKSLI